MKILLIFGTLVAVASAQRQTRNGGRSCNDRHQSCRSWSDIGECQKNPNFMNDNCKKSCNNCPSAVVNPAFTTPPPVTRSPADVNPAANASSTTVTSNPDWCTSLSPPGFWIVAGTRTSKPCPVGTHSVSGEIRLGAQCCQPVGTKDLCSEMKGTCVNPKRLGCEPQAAMKIYNVSFPNITEKYCGNSVPESPACCAPSGQVFTVDIENALAFTFENTFIYNSWEVESGRRLVDYTQLIRNELRGFLMILDKYLKAPDHIHSHTKEFIGTVKRYVGDHSFDASGLQQEFIELQRGGDAYLSAWQPSVSCHNINKGTCYNNSYLASCGLWNMFHTMTVSAKKANADDPLEVLQAIRGFIHNLFFCGLCRHHFLGMYNQTIGLHDSVKTTDDAILWLWCAHNAVNQEWTDWQSKHHLGGWPPHPQFPLPGTCPDCWPGSPGGEYPTCATLFCNGQQGLGKCFSAEFNGTTTQVPDYYFSKPHVLAYLKQVYSGPYSKLNSKLNSRENKLTFREDIHCPH